MAFSFGTARKGMRMNRDKVEEFMHTRCKGRKNIISCASLQKSLHISEQELRKQVNRLRRDMVPIASNRYGYYYAESASDIYYTIKGLEKLRNSIDETICGLIGAMGKFERKKL